MYSRNTDSTCELYRDSWTLQQTYTPSWIVDKFGLFASGLLLEMRWRLDTFSSGTARLVNLSPSSQSTRVVTPCDDRHPQIGLKVKPNKTESRAR